MRATIVDLRYHMRDVLGALDRGETVVVLHRGKEKARLTPISSPSKTSVEGAPRTKDQPFFGLWRDREYLADPASYVRDLRQTRPLLSPASHKKRSIVKKQK